MLFERVDGGGQTVAKVRRLLMGREKLASSDNGKMRGKGTGGV